MIISFNKANLVWRYYDYSTTVIWVFNKDKFVSQNTTWFIDKYLKIDMPANRVEYRRKGDESKQRVHQPISTCPYKLSRKEIEFLTK